MQLFNTALISALLAVGVSSACAQQNWPSKTVRIVVSNSPAAATSLAARIFADNLARAVNKPVVVENRPGADGYIGAQAVASAEPDGYTLFFASQSIFGIDPNIKKKMPVDPVKDFSPIAIMIDDTGATGVFVHPSLPVKTMQELAAYGRANKDKLSYATVVPLFSMIGAWIAKRGEFEWLDVPYKSSAQAFQDTLSGRVPVILTAVGPFEQYLKAGKTRLLAVTRALDDYPQVPTLASLYPGFKQTSYVVLMAPAKMPAALVARINKAAASVVESPKFNKDLSKVRWRNLKGARTPEGVAAFLSDARADWGAFVREIGITPH